MLSISLNRAFFSHVANTQAQQQKSEDEEKTFHRIGYRLENGKAEIFSILNFTSSKNQRIVEPILEHDHKVVKNPPNLGLVLSVVKLTNILKAAFFGLYSFAKKLQATNYEYRKAAQKCISRNIFSLLSTLLTTQLEMMTNFYALS